ncbi:MAG: PD-(D/E)XK nuclease family protein, partial [Nitrospinota bacterium]
VPRRLADRFAERVTSDPFWTPSEWTARLLLGGQNPEGLQAVRGLEPGVLNGCFEAGDHLGQPGPRLTDRDGMTGKLPDLWTELRKRGFSPTALETYAQCPFKFFASRVLGLEEPEDLEEVTELDSLTIGVLLHDVFQRFFYQWSKKESADPSRLLSQVIESTLDEFEANHPVGYPLLWQGTRGRVRWLATDYAEKELRFLQESGFRPFAFEEMSDARIPEIPGSPSILRGVKIKGRLDRLDRREGGDGVELRVVDYKFKGGKNAAKRKMERDALRGRTLQPAFYVLLAEAGEPGVKASAELHYLAPLWPDPAGSRDICPPGAWESPWAREMGDTLAESLKGIRDGKFYIIPHDGDYGHCSYCPYQVLCRKNHRPTRYRQKADPRTHRIEDLSEKEWPPKPRPG